MPHLTKPRRRRPLFEPVEPRLLFTTLPATTTSLTLSTPVTAANQPITLTATVTSDPGSPAPAGTVAFFEVTQGSVSSNTLVSYTNPSTQLPESAVLVGTAALQPDGTATLSLASVPSSSGYYTGQFRAAFLGSTPAFSLATGLTPTHATPDQPLGPNPTPSTNDFVTYLLFPQDHALSLHNAQLTVLSNLPANATTLTPNTLSGYTDQYGNQNDFTIITDPPSPLRDYYPTAPYVFAASADPVLVSISVSHVTHYSPYAGYGYGGYVAYPNLYTYTADLTPLPALAHAFDSNPDFLSSVSSVGTPATSEPASLALLASSDTGSYTNPPTFTVSVFNPDGTQRLSRTAPAFHLNPDVNLRTARAGLVVSTGGGSGFSGESSFNGGDWYTPPPPFVAPGPFPTGTVSFFDEHDTLLATVPLDADGNASFVPDPRTFPLGSHAVHATYSGDATFLPASAAPATFTITHTPTSTYLYTSSGPVYAGGTFALAADVSDFDIVTPTGTVTFTDENNAVLAIVPLGQTSSIHLILAAGTHTITASYAGDADCLPSSATTTVTILDGSPPVVLPPYYHPDPGYLPNPFPGTITDLSPDALTPNYLPNYFNNYFPTSFNRYFPGGTLSFDASVLYTGTGHPLAPDAPVTFALSLDDIAGNADDIPLTAQPTLADTIDLHFDDDGHATRRNTYTAALPGDLAPGSYHIVATVDPGNTIAETDETNNTLVSSWTITVADQASDPSLHPVPTQPTPILVTPDLSGSLTPAHPTATVNAPASLKLTLTNSSKTKSVARRYAITYYLSSDATFSSDDAKFSKQVINVNLGKKQTKSYALSYKLPTTAPLGTRYLIAVADVADGLPSITSGVKVASTKPLKILGPHLTATVRSVTPTNRPNTAKVTVRVFNDGLAPFTGPATLRLLSDDTLLLTARKTITLKAGKYTDYTFTLRRPAGSTFSVTLA